MTAFFARAWLSIFLRHAATRETFSVSVDPDERAWCDGLRRGDTAAFDAVFAAYRRRLYAYFVRMTRRRDIAEDLLQETFMRLAQHAKQLTPDTRLAAWLFTVGALARRSAGPARRPCARSSPATCPRASPPVDDRSPLEALADSQAQLALERAFAALPPGVPRGRAARRDRRHAADRGRRRSSACAPTLSASASRAPAPSLPQHSAITPRHHGGRDER